MGFGGAHSMNTVIKNNKIMLGKRKRLHQLDLDHSNDAYQKLDDHKQMNAHEFATFQKEQFKKRKEEKKRRRYLLLLTTVIVLVVVVSFLLLWNNYDFDLLTSPQFQ